MSGKSPNVVIRVPERTPFDKSHKWYGTHNVGSLVPLLVDEVIGNTKVKCKMAIGVTLPPLAADTLMNLSYKVEAFFVPHRLCSASYESWYCQMGDENVLIGQKDDNTNAIYNSSDDLTLTLPYFKTAPTDPLKIDDPAGRLDPLTSQVKRVDWNAPGTLSDMLGVKGVLNSTTAQSFQIAPWIAYNLIWAHWYRRTDIQKDPFCKPYSPHSFDASYLSPNPHGACAVSLLPYMPFYGDYLTCSDSNSSAFEFMDGHNMFEFRQRNFGFDYFTNAFATASLANFEVTVSSNKFSISQLRVQNSAQQFSEAMMLPGKRYIDVNHARTGARITDALVQKPVFLGSASYDVYTRGVSVTADNVAPSGTRNPFSDYAGGRVGNAYGSGSDFIIDGFVAKEAGYIFVIGSLVPRVNYSSGIRRYLRRYITGSQADITDMANHMLQNVGYQPIFTSELVSQANHGTSVFGYTDRYADWMNYESEVHGLYSNNEDLQAFVSQRYLSGTTGISSSFLQIPVDYLDGVTNAAVSIGRMSCMVQCDFDYKVTMPLYEYSQPSLQNPAYEHGKPIVIHRGGFRF